MAASNNGRFIGKKVPFKLTEEAIRKSWGDKVAEVKLHENGFYFFHVPDNEFRKKIIDSSPVSIFNCTLLLQQWHSKFKLKKGVLDTIPIWVRLRDIPFWLWSPAGIGSIASAIGKPLYVDLQTQQMARISFVRVCVELQATKPRAEQVKFCWDGEVNIINVEYEWKPLACPSCGIFGHKEGSKGFDCGPDQSIVKSVTPAASPSNLVHKTGHDEQLHRDEGWVHVHSRKGKTSAAKSAPGPSHCPPASTVGLDQPSSISLVPQNQLHTDSVFAPDPAQLPPSLAAVPDQLLQNRCLELNTIRTEHYTSTICSSLGPDKEVNAVGPAGPGMSFIAPDLPLETNSGGVAPLMLGLQPGREQEALGAVLHSTEEQIAEILPLTASGPQGRLQQQIEDFQINSHTSSEASSCAHEGEEISGSEEQIMGDHAIVSPPTTRSRTLASYTVEDPAKASLGHDPSLSCFDTTSGPSSSKKNKKRRTRRAQR